MFISELEPELQEEVRLCLAKWSKIPPEEYNAKVPYNYENEEMEEAVRYCLQCMKENKPFDFKFKADEEYEKRRER
jgi:hypothetical protein